MASLLPRFLRRSSRVSAGFASSIHLRSVPFGRLSSPFTHRYYYTSPGRFTSVHGVGSSSDYAKRRKESLETEFGHILGARSRALFVYARFGPLLALYRASIVSFEVSELTFWHFILKNIHKRADKVVVLSFDTITRQEYTQACRKLNYLFYTQEYTQACIFGLLVRRSSRVLQKEVVVLI